MNIINVTKKEGEEMIFKKMEMQQKGKNGKFSIEDSKEVVHEFLI